VVGVVHGLGTRSGRRESFLGLSQKKHPGPPAPARPRHVAHGWITGQQARPQTLRGQRPARTFDCSRHYA
jgi:hypothetical protein